MNFTENSRQSLNIKLSLVVRLVVNFYRNNSIFKIFQIKIVESLNFSPHLVTNRYNIIASPRFFFQFTGQYFANEKKGKM